MLTEVSIDSMKIDPQHVKEKTKTLGFISLKANILGLAACTSKSIGNYKANANFDRM